MTQSAKPVVREWDMSRVTTYYVWRRGDGYVGATAYKPLQSGRDGFDLLLQTESWGEALTRLLAERDEKHYAVVASWHQPSAALEDGKGIDR